MKLKCPNCQITGEVPDELAGKTITCRCGQRFPVPMVSPFTVDQEPVTKTVVPQPLPSSPPQQSNTPQHSQSIIAGICVAVIIIGGIIAWSTGMLSEISKDLGIGSIVGGVKHYTMAKYEQLTDGMSYTEAVSVLGDGGKEQSRSHMDGVPGVTPAIDTVAYAWQNPDGSNIILMFQNDKMQNKAQAGL